MTKTEELDAVIVGAGFAGLYQLMELRDAGFKVRVYDFAGDIGGIWYWNCYPGARVDSTAPLYQYSREDLWRDWEYSELFPAWTEIREYFNYVDKKLDLRKDVQLNTRITSATFDGASNRWIVKTDKGDEVRCKYFVICTGFATKPLYPNIEGLDTFAGPVAHAGRWPQEGVDFKNKRIAVIGTGSSGVQMAEQASLVAKQLTVFQRTPALALPLRQVKLDDATREKMKAETGKILAMRGDTFAGFDYEFTTKSWADSTPEEREGEIERLWSIGAFRPWLGNFPEVIADKDASNFAYAIWRKKVHARVKDPRLAEKLAPEKAPIYYGTKRMGLEQWYFELFNQDNVELVDIKDNPIVRVTPKGIQTKDKFYELDLILLGTGFDAVKGGIPQIDIRNSEGQSLAQYWDKAFRTAYGTCAAGFPNLFFLYGPQSPSVVVNGPTLAEEQGKWVVGCIKYMRDRQLNRITATAEAEDYWKEQVTTFFNATLLPHTRSWWFGGNIEGRELEPMFYIGGLPRYKEELNASARADYKGFSLS